MSRTDTPAEFMQKFVAGSVPQAMEGFYRGELTHTFPRTIPESLGSLLLKGWLPWLGKCWYPQVQMGDNILPLYLQRLFLMKYGETYDFRAGFGGFHALPFSLSVQQGLADPIQVLRLNYNLEQNPAVVRSVVDELVDAGNNTYLGKAYVIKDNTPRLVACFTLFK